MTSLVSGVIQHLRRTVPLYDYVKLSDAQLLEDYINRQSEAALSALVHRHGPMIWGVCRRVLANYHDAEDAFQATYLVLVRKATSIVPRHMVGNWLHGVALQTALKARATTARRNKREMQLIDLPEKPATAQEPHRDLQSLLDEELKRLPNRYRAVIILCDLEGKTRKEAAEQLECPEGTVAGHLVRARAMLAKRLARHGLMVSEGTLVSMLLQLGASASVPASVLSVTIRAAKQFAAGHAVIPNAVSARIAALTEGVPKAMFLSKLRIAMVVVSMVALLCCAAILTSEAKETKVLISHSLEGKKEPANQKQEDDDKIKATLLALDEELWEAHAKSDPKPFEKYLAENYRSVWHVNAGKLDKAATIEHVKRFKYTDKDIQEIEVVRLDKDGAVLTYVATYKASEGNEAPVTLRTRCTYVWTKRNNGWAIAFCQGCGEEIPPVPALVETNPIVLKP
jgi:RNA polymerase sigma factor (sigma-70 family)